MLVSFARVRVVPDVTDVLVFPSSAVTEFCDVSPCCSDCEFVEPQSFSFFKKRALYARRDEKRLPITRRRMTPHTFVQNSYTSIESEQGSYEWEGRGWDARERTMIARTRQYLERSYSAKVRVEELEGLLGPEDVDVDFRRILKEARDERGSTIFETFSSNDMSFLVAEWSRWDKYKRSP